MAFRSAKKWGNPGWSLSSSMDDFGVKSMATKNTKSHKKNVELQPDNLLSEEIVITELHCEEKGCRISFFVFFVCVVIFF